ncbi:hypothetical protein CAOG_000527 [Capsaspora owczarzaki ATCC 30864]|uniref:FAD/NAD(P)-binding domain-containing protein n=1 Tax=Capsaspora owczarzaki (strain ATCC 30864) TaxID=595528 RepID=A0A0D2WH99_CAPO3|nr:hypothetical protein CAOG_000527 [Capsaspora owczarzaki ATCC 30864]
MLTGNLPKLLAFSGSAPSAIGVAAARSLCSGGVLVAHSTPGPGMHSAARDAPRAVAAAEEGVANPTRSGSDDAHPGYVPEPTEPGDRRHRLVIVGSGWGGFSLLKYADAKRVHVSMVSARPFFLFTPLLASTCVGTLEFRSIQEPVRNMRFPNEGDFHQAIVTGVDTSKQLLLCQSALDASYKYSVHYDTLVLGVGMRPNTFNIEGVTKYGHFLKELADARAIRVHLLRNLELACEPGVSAEERQRLLTVVIAGGGATGVEFGAELHDFLVQDLPKLYPHLQDHIRIVLVEPNDILGAFDSRLRTFAERKIRQRRDMTIVRKFIVDVTEKNVHFKDGTTHPFGVLVWVTGLAPSPLAVSLSQFPKNKQHQFVVDQQLRVTGIPNVYALGDCAAMTPALPCTAQVAERQGRYLASVLSNLGSDSAAVASAPPFVFKSMGMMAYVGDHDAISDLPVTKLSGKDA